MTDKAAPLPSAQNVVQDAKAAVESTFDNMKAGEYMVHVFLEETRGLINPVDKEAAIDCIITVQCFNKKRYTQVKKGLHSGATTWDEHFFFDKVIENVQAIEHKSITITVSNHKLLGEDAVLGVIELDFSQVYGSDKHTINHRWAALANLNKNFQNILGFLKFSVSVVTEGDPIVQLKPEEIGTGFEQQNVLMPPHMDKTLYQITITVNRGEQIKKMDSWGGTVDPFLKFKLGPIELKTKTITNNINPIWNQIIKIPIALPTISDKLTIELFDYDQVKSNEIIGTSHISIKEIEAGRFDQFAWKSFYSCPPGASGKFANLMNTLPELASHWCGRINFKITMEKNKNAQAGVVDLTDANVVNAVNKEPFFKYDLRAEAYWGMNLPENNKKYSIKIRWAMYESKTKDKEVPQGRMCNWFETLPIISGSFPDKKLEYTPDVLVYLCKDGKHFSFIRLPSSYFLKQDRKAELFYFKIDKSVSNVRDDLAGVVKLRIWVSTPGPEIQLSVGGWDKPLLKKPEMKKWRVIVNLYQAQDLIAADSDGSSDPICEIYFSGWIFRSPPIMNTLNPIWNYRMDFPAEFDDFSECPPFLLSVWDYDGPGMKDDYLGGTVLNISDSCLGKDKPVLPTWHQLKYGTLNKDFGKVLISFNIYPATVQTIPYGSIDPPTTKYWLNMKVLGLRGLKSLGVVNVKKPFIKFDLNSVHPPQHRQHVVEKKYVQTQPLDKGPNANILTVINMELNLPTDSLYCPSLSCRVHDFYLRGMSQPLLGTFSINLGTFLDQTKARVLAKKAKEAKLTGSLDSTALKINTQFVEQAKTIKKLEKSVNIVEDEDDEEDEEQTSLIDTTKKQLDTTKDKLFSSLKVKSDTEATTTTAVAPLGKLFNIGGLTEKTMKNFIEDAESRIFPIPIDKVALKPTYSYDKAKGYHLEENFPDLNSYVELGYDGKTRREKHYRYMVDKALEDTDFVDPSPFDEIEIKRGSQVSDDSIFSKVFGGSHKKEQPAESETVGFFKAMITIMTEEEKKAADAFVLNAVEKKTPKVDHIKESLLGIPDIDFLKKANCLVRCYIIDAANLAPKDENSNSDPYLKLEIGNQTVVDSDNWQEDEPNPKFYKMFEFPVTVPGAGLLRITVMDKDDFSKDDLIGETCIDIEDRWFSKKFRRLEEPPVETRQLYNPQSRISQGSLRLFVDIIPRENNFTKKKWDIAAKPPQKFEIRCIVWEVEDLPITDGSGQIDIYITAKLDDGTKLATDTHWASQNGRGSFNWRMVFPVTLPLKSNRITFQAWDKDIISADDHIAEATFDFTKLANEAFMYEQGTKMFTKDKKSDKIEIDLYRSDDKKGGALSKAGKLKVSFEVVTDQTASLNKVGQGRSDPNHEPYLPPPIGRIKFSLNPLDMWEMYVGPVYRHKIYMACAAVIGIVMLVLMFPQLLVAFIMNIF